MHTAARSHVDHIIGVADHIKVVFDNDNCRTVIDQAFENSMKKPTRYTVWYRIGLPQKGEDMASQEKYTILYARLSQEDLQKKNGKEDDSNSILNQRLYLEKYAADHGFSYTKFISDDGYTGTNFNRPGWQKVMELVESDQVATIIVKDYCAIIGLNQKDLENQGILA